jgi:hypothetical protein
MRAGGKAFGKKIMPDTPGTMGAVGIFEAAFDLFQENLLIPAWWLGERLSQAWRPEREISSASHSHGEEDQKSIQ